MECTATGSVWHANAGSELGLLVTCVDQSAIVAEQKEVPSCHACRLGVHVIKILVQGRQGCTVVLRDDATAFGKPTQRFKHSVMCHNASDASNHVPSQGQKNEIMLPSLFSHAWGVLGRSARKPQDLQEKQVRMEWCDEPR